MIRCAASVLEYMGKEEVARVRKMVIEVGGAAYFRHFHNDTTIRRMQNVEELELLTQSWGTHSWYRGGDMSVENLTDDLGARGCRIRGGDVLK